MGKWLKSNPTLCDVIYGQPLQLYSYLFPQSDSENDHVEFMDKKDDFEEISSMVEKSTQTLVEEQKIVEKLRGLRHPTSILFHHPNFMIPDINLTPTTLEELNDL